MPAYGMIQARIDNTVKAEATAVLAGIGLTVSDAVRLMLVRVAHDKALPFNPLIPNTQTIAAMQEAEGGGLKRFTSVEALFEYLHADN